MSYSTVPLKSLILAATGFLLFALPRAEAAEKTRPNFLLIFSDDQGVADIGCYGSEIPTPHIDSLARDGLKFNSWYVASSICTPSRYGLLTGRNPSRSRDALLGALMFLDPQDRSRGIYPDETTIATQLRSAGYRTALIGKWHLGHGDSRHLPNANGFDYSYGHTAGCVDFFTMDYGNTPDWYRNGIPIDQTGYATDLITDEAVAFLSTHDASTPFFLFLPYNAPHFGKGWDDGNDRTVNLLQPHPRDLARFPEITDPTRRKFAAKVAALDDGIGRVLRTLKEQRLEENTLVIFMTDHGGDPNFGGSNHPLRAGKATLFEGGIRVPCLMRWPGKIAAGTETDAVSSALDLFPTFCSLAQIEALPSPLDGINLTRLLLENAPNPERELFWELGSHQMLDRGRWSALRQQHWKYVQTPNDGEWLFDLGQDPHETTNLKEAYPEEFRRLRQRAKNLTQNYRSSAATGARH